MSGVGTEMVSAKGELGTVVGCSVRARGEGRVEVRVWRTRCVVGSGDGWVS